MLIFYNMRRNKNIFLVCNSLLINLHLNDEIEIVILALNGYVQI